MSAPPATSCNEARAPAQAPAAGKPIIPCMPDLQRVLAVTEALWLGRAEQARHRVLAHGLPPQSLDAWIAECQHLRARRFADPIRRDCAAPPHTWDMVAMVLARGGSRGVPRKALRCVDGVPLVARAVAVCRAVPAVRRVLINTDCPEIAAVACAAGAEAPFLRPAELAGDDVSPFDPWMFAQMWMLLIERRVPDFLLTVSATHPFTDPAQIPRALHRLTAANRPALHTVARLPSVSLDFLTLHNGMAIPLPNHPPDGQTAGAHASCGTESFLQCGAFSLESHRPGYRSAPWQRPDMSVAPGPDGNPVAHVLPAVQGLDVDEPWDIAAACLLRHASANFPPCTPADIAAHRVRTAQMASATPPHCPPLTCVVVLLPPEGVSDTASRLPPRNAADGGTDEGEARSPNDYTEGDTDDSTDTPYLQLDGIPVPCRVMDAVLGAFGRPDSMQHGTPLTRARIGQITHCLPVFIAGQGAMAQAVATRYGLNLLPPPPAPRSRTANGAWPVPLFRHADLTGEAAPHVHGVHPALAGRAVLYVDGRAAMLDAATLRAFLAAALPPDGRGASLRQPVCSVSPAPIHPAHLKHINAAGEVVSAPGIPARRQDLPPVWCRDGALTLLPAVSATASDNVTLPYLPVPIDSVQGMLVNTRLDAARAMARAKHVPDYSGLAQAAGQGDIPEKQ